MILLVNSVPKIALTKYNETLADLQHSVLGRAAKIQKLTEVEQINLDSEWTEFIKNLVEFGNKNYLKSYSLRLEME